VADGPPLRLPILGAADVTGKVGVPHFSRLLREVGPFRGNDSLHHLRTACLLDNGVGSLSSEPWLFEHTKSTQRFRSRHRCLIGAKVAAPLLFPFCSNCLFWRDRWYCLTSEEISNGFLKLRRCLQICR